MFAGMSAFICASAYTAKRLTLHAFVPVAFEVVSCLAPAPFQNAEYHDVKSLIRMGEMVEDKHTMGMRVFH
jgi:hypothetical protein